MGLQTDIIIPWEYGTPNVGKDALNYFDFYLGYQGPNLEKTDTEAGIFYYTKKGWTLFLNVATWHPDGEWYEKEIDVKPGSTHTMELRNNRDHTVSFYWDGRRKFTGTMNIDPDRRMPTTGGWVKMSHGKVNQNGSMFYTGARYINPQFRLNNGKYTNWTASSYGYAPANTGMISDFTINAQFPVATDLLPS